MAVTPRARGLAVGETQGFVQGCVVLRRGAGLRNGLWKGKRVVGLGHRGPAGKAGTVNAAAARRLRRGGSRSR